MRKSFEKLFVLFDLFGWINDVLSNGNVQSASKLRTSAHEFKITHISFNFNLGACQQYINSTLSVWIAWFSCGTISQWVQTQNLEQQQKYKEIYFFVAKLSTIEYTAQKSAFTSFIASISKLMMKSCLHKSIGLTNLNC